MSKESANPARRPELADPRRVLYAPAARNELRPDCRSLRHQRQRDREAHRKRHGGAGTAHAQGVETTMNVDTIARDPSPAEFAEAAAWVARLHGPNRSLKVERGLRRWLDAGSTHAAAFEAMT